MHPFVAWSKTYAPTRTLTSTTAMVAIIARAVALSLILRISYATYWTAGKEVRKDALC